MEQPQKIEIDRTRSSATRDGTLYTLTFKLNEPPGPEWTRVWQEKQAAHRRTWPSLSSDAVSTQVQISAQNEVADKTKAALEQCQAWVGMVNEAVAEAYQAALEQDEKHQQTVESMVLSELANWASDDDSNDDDDDDDD